VSSRIGRGTGWVLTEGDRIADTIAFWRKFRGQRFSSLVRWAKAETRRLTMICKHCQDQIEAGARPVPAVGPADAEVAILGPSPGYHEVEEGEPFVGKDADLLLSTLEDLGVDWQDLWLQHVTRCGLPAGRAAPGVKWLRACREACFPSMLECEPKVIIALGNDAWKMLTDNSKASVTKQRGAVYKYKDIPIVCTWEPRACHKDPNKRAQFEEDLRAYILEDAWDKEEWDPQWELADRLPEEYDDIRGNVTLDVETISCDPEKDPKGALSVHRGQLNLTGIATRSDIPTLIEHPDAVAHNIPFSLSPPEGDRAWQDIRERLIFNPNVQLEGAGLQFDLQWFLLPHEMPLCTVEDICVKHYLLDDQAETRALKPLIRHYTNKVEYAADNVRDLNDEDLHRYNAIDLYGTEMVSDGIDNDLLQSGIDYDRPFNLLRRVQPILAAMTRTGFPVMKSRAMKVAKSEGQKVEKLERALRKKLEPLEGRVLECKKRINARSKNPKKEGTKAYDKYMAGGLNFSSPPQMSEFVFGFWDRHANGGRGTVRRSKGLNLTPPEHLMGWKTQTDLFSCGEKYLSAVLDQDQTGFIEAYLALRAVRDNYKKYVLQFLNAIEDDGCVHPEYFVFKSKDNLYDPGNESGTGTGRLSAKNPSVHNTPKKHPIREAFVPFSNGWLLQMDWSTLEMVIQGYIADDPQLRGRPGRVRDLPRRSEDRQLRDPVRYHPVGCHGQDGHRRRGRGTGPDRSVVRQVFWCPRLSAGAQGAGPGPVLRRLGHRPAPALHEPGPDAPVEGSVHQEGGTQAAARARAEGHQLPDPVTGQRPEPDVPLRVGGDGRSQDCLAPDLRPRLGRILRRFCEEKGPSSTNDGRVVPDPVQGCHHGVVRARHGRAPPG
jgi:DNA polymerase